MAQSKQEKAYATAVTGTITLTMGQWQIVLHWLQYGADYHHAKMHEWRAVCHDKKMGAEKAAEHEREGTAAQVLHKIIEETLYPPPPKPEPE